MLPAYARLRRRDEFTSALRGGRRAGRASLVVHLASPGSPVPVPAQAGFVVSKAVGNSVVRHRVIRRLRHLVAARLDRLPTGATLVVRALPPAATRSSDVLADDLDAALRRVLGRST